MRTYVIRRIVQFLPTLLLATIGIWAMIFALPGNPAQVVAGPNATPAQLEAITERMGLDRPVLTQYFIWISHALHGDLGSSFISGHSVTSLIGDRLMATVQLAVLAMVLVILTAIPLGVVSALRPNSLAGRTTRTILALGLAVPSFWLGILLTLVFSITLQVFPAASDYAPVWQDPGAAFSNTLLPAIALAFAPATITARFVAASLREAIHADFVRTARAKGVREPSVIVRHALRNALLPAVTAAGIQLGHLLAGAVVVEVVFNYPGLGRLLFTSLTQRDYALIQALILLAVLLFLVINVVVDIVYAVLDPRIRVS